MPDVKGYKLPNHDETYMYADAYAREELAKKAPSGYGYGEPAIAAGNCATEADLEASLNSIASTMKNMESKRIHFNVDTIGSYSLYGTLTKHSDSFLTMEATVFATGWKIVKIKYSGTWQPWEWENPPLLSNVTYRTTKRYDDKPVYVRRRVFTISAEKLVYFDPGAYPDLSKIISIQGSVYNSGSGWRFQIPSTHCDVDVEPNGYKLHSSDFDMRNHTCDIVISWYA